MSVPVRTGVAAAARCLALDQLAAQVVDALQAAAVPTVLLKGAGLARRLYPDRPDRRRYSDVDVLVAPATFDRAQEVLSGLGLQDSFAGLRTDEQHWHERLWRRPGTGALAVDLHRGFAGVGDPGAFWEILDAGSEPLALSGAAVRVPDAAGCALVVGLHAARPGLGRKASTDLAAALALLPDRVWEEAAAFARRSGSTSAFARGLSQDPAGAALCTRLGLRAEGTLADALAARGTYGLVLSLASLADLPGPTATLQRLGSLLVPSRAYLRYTQPLARRGNVGLLVAYLVRLARLAGKAPSVVLAVRRAGRAHAPDHRPTVGGLRRVVRALAGLDGRDRLTCGWSVLALRRARRQLATAPLAELDLRGPPAAGRGGARTVRRVLTHRGASCLETATVMQRWWAGQGVAWDVLIGVSAPAEGFRAHAWLDDPGDPDHAHVGLAEIHRRPTPAAWLAADRPATRARG